MCPLTPHSQLVTRLWAGRCPERLGEKDGWPNQTSSQGSRLDWRGRGSWQPPGSVSGKPKVTHKPKQVAATQTQPRVENSPLWEKQAPGKEGHGLPTVPVFGAYILPEAGGLAFVAAAWPQWKEVRVPTKLQAGPGLLEGGRFAHCVSEQEQEIARLHSSLHKQPARRAPKYSSTEGMRARGHQHPVYGDLDTGLSS